MIVGEVDVVEAQARVISALSVTISTLYQALLQHVQAEELDRLPCVVDLQRAEAHLQTIMPQERT